MSVRNAGGDEVGRYDTKSTLDATLFEERSSIETAAGYRSIGSQKSCPYSKGKDDRKASSKDRARVSNRCTTNERPRIHCD